MVFNVEKLNSHSHLKNFFRKEGVFRCYFSFWNLNLSFFGRKLNEKSLRFINSAPTKGIYIRITNYKFTQPKILKKVSNKIKIVFLHSHLRLNINPQNIKA